MAALLLLVYSLATMVQLAVLGGQPATAAEAFRLLQEDRVVGLLRLDLPTVLALPLYYVLFLGLFAALRRADPPRTTLATVLAFAGVTLVLATPMGLSMLPLADQYAAATSAEARAQLLAAGETVLAIDMWHSTSAFVGGLLLQAGGRSGVRRHAAHARLQPDDGAGRHPDPRARSRPRRAGPVRAGGRVRLHGGGRAALPAVVSPGRPTPPAARRAAAGLA